MLPAGTPDHVAPRDVGPSNGVFPVGCKWRDVQPEGHQRGFWAVVQYEFWADAAQQWVAEMPEACMIKGEASTRR